MPELLNKSDVMHIINAENAVVLCCMRLRSTDEVLYSIASQINSLQTIQNTIEAEPVRHGRWITTEYNSYADGAPVWDKWECSECGHEHRGEEDTLTAFCPDCGAKMYADGENISKERFAEIMGGTDNG